MSQLVKVADAAVAQIAAARDAGELVSVQLDPVRSWAHIDDEVKECDGLLVDVVGVRYESSDLMSQTRIGYQPTIEIYVRMKFGQKHRDQNGRLKTASVDPLVLLVEQLGELFVVRKRPPTMTEATWLQTRILSAFSKKHLRERQMFFGALAVTFNAPKSITPVLT